MCWAHGGLTFPEPSVNQTLVTSFSSVNMLKMGWGAWCWTGDPTPWGCPGWEQGLLGDWLPGHLLTGGPWDGGPRGGPPGSPAAEKGA